LRSRNDITPAYRPGAATPFLLREGAPKQNNHVPERVLVWNSESVVPETKPSSEIMGVSSQIDVVTPTLKN
jgi:hypothetical protein